MQIGELEIAGRGLGGRAQIAKIEEVGGSINRVRAGIAIVVIT